MDVTTKAIALKTTDFNESDKFITLFSLEYGKISVRARGIRKGTAKLRFCADQFCFGQYELVRSTDDRYTLKNCDQIESFYSIRQDIVVYYSACVMAECLCNFTQEGQSDPTLFIQFLKALRCLVEGVDPLVVTARFLFGFLKSQGYGADFTHCNQCGSKNKLFFSTESGQTLCDNCRGQNSISISARVASASGLIDDVPYEKLSGLHFTGECLKDLLGVLGKYYAFTYSPLKTLTELIKLA